MGTLKEMENLRLDMDSEVIGDDYFNLDTYEKDSFSSKSVIKTTSKPYVKVVKNLKRDLSNQSSKSKIPIESKNSSNLKQRKDNSKTKLTSSSKISLYTSISPGKTRASKSPGKSTIFSTINNSSKNITDVVNNAKKPILRKIFIVNKDSNNISIDSILNFEMVKNFTALNYKDLTLEELIYSAEISNVYRGKYMHLPVAIKVYDIAKLKEDDIVKKLNKKLLYLLNLI
jgi:hypothetical protein